MAPIVTTGISVVGKTLSHASSLCWRPCPRKILELCMSSLRPSHAFFRRIEKQRAMLIFQPMPTFLDICVSALHRGHANLPGSLEGALEAAVQLQKGVGNHGPAPRGLLERMAELLRRGVLDPSMVYAFLMTNGGQQVPQAKSKAKARARSRAMTNEEAEQTPDVSLPRPPPERPPIVFERCETLEPSTARPKVRISRKSQPRNAEEIIGASAQE